MKKILSLVMSMAMVLSLAACGGSASTSTDASTSAGASVSTEASDFKVGAIYINSKNDTAESARDYLEPLCRV